MAVGMILGRNEGEKERRKRERGREPGSSCTLKEKTELLSYSLSCSTDKLINAI
jgi:hypothetical protein